MNQIEEILFDSDLPENHAELKSRIRIGEVFQLPNEQYALVCIHCSEEFQYFSEFTSHVQDHLSQLQPQEADLQPIPLEFIKTEIEIDDVKQNSTINEQETIPQERNGMESLQIEKMSTETSQLKEDESYFDDNFDDDFDDDFEVGSNNQQQDQQSTSADSKTKQMKEKKSTKSMNQIFYEEQTKPESNVEATNAYEELLAKHTVSIDDLMDPTKFEMFKTEKMDKIKYRAVIKILTKNGKRPKAINDHLRAVYGKSAPSYSCVKIWAKEFKRGKESLGDDPRSGRRKIIDANEKHLCFTCGAQFKRKHNLTEHMLTHEEAKFKCDICDQKFRRSCKMLVHRRKHPEKMKYSCKFCGLGFLRPVAVKKHTNLHCKRNKNKEI